MWLRYLSKRFDYDPFGGARADASSGSVAVDDAAFTGAARDPQIGLYNLRARLYAPGTGRFTQSDPLGDVVGPKWPLPGARRALSWEALGCRRRTEEPAPCTCPNILPSAASKSCTG